jgi:phosphopantetheinyl transferase
MTTTKGDVDVWVCAETDRPSVEVVRRVLDSYPRRAGDERRHSVSHSEGVLLVAVAPHRRVGVDVERVRERGVTALPRHALTRSELEALSTVDPADRLAVFLGYWTRKEALLKAAGVGLAVEPNLIEVSVAAVRSQPIVVPEALGRGIGWWIAELVLPGYAAALATDGPVSTIRMIDATGADQSSPRIARSRSAWAGAVGSSSCRRNT